MSGPTLSATLEAKLDKFKSDMDQAGSIAEDAVKKIEDAFSKANPQLGGLGGGLLGSTGLATILGGGAVAGILKVLSDANKEMADLDDNAKRVGLTLGQFQADQFAAALKGLSNADFTSGVTALATKLNDASRTENDFTKLLDANNIKWKDQNDKVIGVQQALTIVADLIKNAGTELDKVKIADMVGLSKEWVAVLDQGGGVFTSNADRAREAGAIIDDSTIKKAAQFQREWNAASAEWKAQMQAALADLVPFLDDLIQKAKDFAKSVTDVQKPNAEQAGSGAAVDQAFDKLATAISNIVHGNGSLDELKKGFADVLQTFVALDQHSDLLPGIDVQVKNLSGDVETFASKFKAAIDSIKASQQKSSGEQFGPLQPFGPEKPAAPVTQFPGDQDSTANFDREIERIKRHSAELTADSLTIGTNAGAHEQLRAELVLLNAASRDNDDITVEQIETYTRLRATMSAQQALAQSGIELTDAQAKSFDQVTQKAGQAAQAAANAKAQFAAANQALQFGGDQFISAIDGIRTGSLTAAQAVNQLVNQLITALEKALLLGQGPLAGIFGLAAAPGSGGTGGFFGALLGLSGGGAATAGKGVVSAFAGGTDFAPGGLALVGEDGPELVALPRGAQVTPNSALRSLPAGLGGGGPQITLQVTNHFAAGINGTDMAAINEQIRQSSEMTLHATVQAIRQGVVGDPHYIQ